MKNFMDLKPWQKCHELVVAIYRKTASFPEDDAGVMTEELRDTALNLQIRIEDALLHRSRKERGIPGSLDVAHAKLARLESGLILCKDIKYVDSKTLRRLGALVAEVQKVIDEMSGKRAVRARNGRFARRVKMANASSLSSSPP